MMTAIWSCKAAAGCCQLSVGPVRFLLSAHPLAHATAASRALYRQSDHQQVASSSRSIIMLQVCQASSGNKQTDRPLADNMDNMDDVIMISDENEAFEDEEFGVYEDEDDDEDGFFEEEGEDFMLAGSDSDPGPQVLTGNVTWGDTALQVANQVLSRPENENLKLYLFRVNVPTKVIEIRLDRLDDVYGSPDLDDIERFSRALQQGLDAGLGLELAGEISFEVSSPGAERALLIPQELNRFKDLPMRVEYMSEVGKLNTMILNFVDMDESEDMSTWELADVKANQAVKGRGLSKKQKAQRYSIRLSELERVRIYVDF